MKSKNQEKLDKWLNIETPKKNSIITIIGWHSDLSMYIGKLKLMVYISDTIKYNKKHELKDEKKKNYLIVKEFSDIELDNINKNSCDKIIVVSDERFAKSLDFIDSDRCALEIAMSLNTCNEKLLLIRNKNTEKIVNLLGGLNAICVNSYDELDKYLIDL